MTLGTLRRLRSRFGSVFTMRTTNGPMVIVGEAGELERLAELDPGSARAGEARRRVLPQAAPRSVFGGDGEAYRTERRSDGAPGTGGCWTRSRRAS